MGDLEVGEQFKHVNISTNLKDPMSISMNPLEPLQWIHIRIPTALIQMHHEAKLEIALPLPLTECCCMEGWGGWWPQCHTVE